MFAHLFKSTEETIILIKNKYNHSINVTYIRTYYSHTIFVCKSKSLRLKTGCSFSSRMMMISPGSIPGSWSPSLVNVIFCPSFIPLSMWTSRILRSLTVFLPWQVLQRSFSKKKLMKSVSLRRLDFPVSKPFFYSLRIWGAPRGRGGENGPLFAHKEG